MLRKLLLIGVGFVLGWKVGRALDFDSTPTATDSIDQADPRRMSAMVRDAIEESNIQSKRTNEDAR